MSAENPLSSASAAAAGADADNDTAHDVVIEEDLDGPAPLTNRVPTFARATDVGSASVETDAPAANSDAGMHRRGSKRRRHDGDGQQPTIIPQLTMFIHAHGVATAADVVSNGSATSDEDESRQHESSSSSSSSSSSDDDNEHGRRAGHAVSHRGDDAEQDGTAHSCWSRCVCCWRT